MSKRSILFALAAAIFASAALVGATGAGAATANTVEVWIGLKNSDDVGTSFDVQAVFQDGEEYVGTATNVWGGSSGFNNAHKITIPLGYSGTAVGDDVLTVYVRVSCASRHVSGTARLWYNDAQADSNVTDEEGDTSYLVAPSSLDETGVGLGPKKTSDVFVKRSGCPVNNTWKSFGTWSP